jgi:alcohol dehydrogenase (cytochrome c)
MIGLRQTAKAAFTAALLSSVSMVAAMAGEVSNYSPVTQQRLENPEPGNWLLYRRTYDGHEYSPLKQSSLLVTLTWPPQRRHSRSLMRVVQT